MGKNVAGEVVLVDEKIADSAEERWERRFGGAVDLLVKGGEVMGIGGELEGNSGGFKSGHVPSVLRIDEKWPEAELRAFPFRRH